MSTFHWICVHFAFRCLCVRLWARTRWAVPPWKPRTWWSHLWMLWKHRKWHQRTSNSLHRWWSWLQNHHSRRRGWGIQTRCWRRKILQWSRTWHPSFEFTIWQIHPLGSAVFPQRMQLCSHQKWHDSVFPRSAPTKESDRTIHYWCTS